MAVFWKLWRETLRRESIAPIIVGITFRELGRVLKTPPRVLLQKHFEQNNHRLRDIFELFER